MTVPPKGPKRNVHERVSDRKQCERGLDYERVPRARPPMEKIDCRRTNGKKQICFDPTGHFLSVSFPKPLHYSPCAAIAYAAVLIALVAICDWRAEINATLGFLCTLLTDRLDPFPMEMESARDVLIFLTLAVTGLLSFSVTRSYRRESERLAAQRAAEEQFEFL